MSKFSLFLRRVFGSRHIDSAKVILRHFFGELTEEVIDAAKHQIALIDWGQALQNGHVTITPELKKEIVTSVIKGMLHKAGVAVPDVAINFLIEWLVANMHIAKMTGAIEEAGGPSDPEQDPAAITVEAPPVPES